MKKFVSLVAALALIFPVFVPQEAQAATSISGDFSTGLVSHWELEETGSADRVDSHGSNDLTAVSSPPSATGARGNALDCDGTADYVEIDDATQSGLEPTGAMSVSMWLDPDSVSNNPIVMNKFGGGGATWGYLFNHFSTNIYWRLESSGNDGRYRTDQIATTSQWTNVLVTYNGSDNLGHIYINGQEVEYTSQTSGPSSIVTNGSPFRLCSSSISVADLYNGQIDEVTFWNVEISSAQATSLYNSGTPLPYSAGGGGGAETPRTFVPQLLYAPPKLFAYT